MHPNPAFCRKTLELCEHLIGCTTAIADLDDEDADDLRQKYDEYHRNVMQARDQSQVVTRHDLAEMLATVMGLCGDKLPTRIMLATDDFTRIVAQWTATALGAADAEEAAPVLEAASDVVQRCQGNRPDGLSMSRADVHLFVTALFREMLRFLEAGECQ